MKKLIIFAIFLFSFSQIEAQWYNNFNTGFDMKSVFFIDLNTGWATGNSNAIFKTTNCGNTWFSQNSGLAFTTNFNSVFFYDNQNGFIVGDPYSGTTVILRTTNGGEDWQLQTVSVPDIKLTRVFFAPQGSNHIGITCGYNSGSNTGIILQTSDYGVNWNQTYSNNGKINALYMLDSCRGYAGGDSILRTQNGGIFWNRILPQSSTVNDLFFIDNSKGWICTESGKIYQTINNGNSWEEQFFNNNNQPFKSIFFINENTGWVSSANGIVYVTTNSGVSWLKQITGINTSLNDIIMISNQVGFAVGSGGKILKTVNSGGTFKSFTQTFTRNDINKPIQPNLLTSDTIHIDENISEENISVEDINITIDTVLNTIDSNLIFIITHKGISDTIIYKVGNDGNDFIGTVLDDSENKPIELGRAPFTDRYRPSRPLSQLNNLSLSGDWVINIYHQGNGMNLDPLRTGVIKAWGMVVTYKVAVPQLITGVGQTPAPVPAKFTLYQNYPNPFNPNTNIKFDISKSTNVTIKVYNILGVLINTLMMDEKLNAGIYEVGFDGSNLASGIYFYKLETSEFSQTKKMVLVK